MAKAVERELGVPVWEHAGIICTGETYKTVVKLTFAKGASLEDPSGLFNASLDGNTRRAIDFHEGDKIDEKALKALIRAAVALNTSAQPPRAPSALRKDQRAPEEGGEFLHADSDFASNFIVRHTALGAQRAEFLAHLRHALLPCLSPRFAA